MSRESLLLLFLFVAGLVACTGNNAEPPPEPPFEETVVVFDEPVTVDLPSGGFVTLPAREDGQSATVTVLQSNDLMAGALSPEMWLTTGVRLAMAESLEWPEGALIEVSLPQLAEAASASAQSFHSEDSVGIINIAGAPESAFGRAVQTLYSLPAFNPSTGFIDLKLPAGLMVAGIDPLEVDIRVAGNVVEWRTKFWPSQEGLFRVVGDEIPSAVSQFDAACGLNNLDALLTTDLHGDTEVAVVMVHGWQTLGQIPQGGDNDRNQVHCTGWIDIMSMFQHAQESQWPELREAADLFTFRYNSDYRIVRSGAKLAAVIERLHEEGYANVILLAHSMGGLVSVEARQRLDHPDYLKGIVTLGTPFMGGIVECMSTVTLSFPEAPDEQSYCGMLRTADHLASPILDFIVPAGGSFDLTQYKGLDGFFNLFSSEDNPYLQRLWEGPDNPNFENIHAIYGDSNLSSMSARFTMKLSISIARITYGHSDGAVPTASAVASKERKRSADDALPYSELTTTVPVARDHGQLLDGCTRCSNGRHGDRSAYDPYFDKVAAALGAFVGPPDSVPTITSISPNPVVVAPEVQPITVSGYGFMPDAVITMFDGANASELPESDVQFVSDSELTIQAVIDKESQDWGITVTNPDSGLLSSKFAFSAVAAASDLVVTSLNAPIEAVAGENLEVSFRISNVGTAVSSPSVTRVRINDDPSGVTTTDTLLAEVQTPSLEPGEYEAYAVEVTIPADLAEDIYTIWVIADADSQAGQVDETNDRAFENIIVLGPLTPCQDPNEIISIPDENLELAVTEQLEMVSGPITCGDMWSLEGLFAGERDVIDLTGLQHATNLLYLHLGDHDTMSGPLHDLTPIAGLVGLINLDIQGNDISELTPLAGLMNMVLLWAAHNEIVDVVPITGLPGLNELDLSYNQIVDISSLATMTALDHLSLRSNLITDISSLVANAGIGAGDTLILIDNCLDLSPGSTDMSNISELLDRGVNVIYETQRDCQ